MQIEYSLSEINGIGQSTEEKLRNFGITSVSQLARMSSEKLSKVKGFGLASANKLISSAKNFLDIKEKDNNENLFNNDFPDNEPLIYNEESQENEKGLEFSKSIDDYTIPQNEKNLEASISEDNSLNETFKSGIDNLELKKEKEISYAKSVKDIVKKNRINDDLIEKSINLDNIDSKKNSDYNDHPYINSEEYLGNIKEQTQKLNYEKDIYAEFNGEKLSRNELIVLIQNIIKNFKSRGFQIFPKNTNLLRNLSQNYELLALKLIKINKVKKLILLIPIQISHLRGSLAIEDDSITYRSVNHEIKMDHELNNQLLNTSISKFAEIQYEIFKNITLEKGLFELINKLVNSRLAIRKTKKNKPLYIHSDQIEFKLVIDPFLVCSSEPLFLEKMISYPFQRRSNLHIISIRNINGLLDYLEKKYMILEGHDKQNSIVKHQNSLQKIFLEARIGSIPFLCFGILLLLIILYSDVFIINTFTRIGMAALGIYMVFLGFSYLKHFNIQKDIIEGYMTPHFKLRWNLDETDLLILKNEMGTSIIDQLIYECFENMNEFSIIPKIEQEKDEELDLELLNDQEDSELEFIANYDNIASKNEQDPLRKKIIAKYSEFLEE